MLISYFQMAKFQLQLCDRLPEGSFTEEETETVPLRTQQNLTPRTSSTLMTGQPPPPPNVPP